MTIRIAVWDDQDTGTAKRKIRESGADVEIVDFSNDEMQNAMAQLVTGFESVPTDALSAELATKLLDLDVLLIDENLRTLEKARCSTAEELVAPLRAFVGCPAVVILNRLYFDMNLTMVEEGLGDIDVKTEVLNRPWLWTDEGGPRGFAPWAWPPLAKARDSWDARLAQVRSGDHALKKAVASALQLDVDSVAAELSGAAEEALTAGQPEPGEPLEVTLEGFFQRGEHPIPVKYRDALAQLPDVVARVCAAELTLWLRRYLLAPQNLLVDVPHLLLRAPWVLAEDPRGIESWNACVIRASLPRESLKMDLLEPHVYPGWRQWAGRPCFYWPSLRNDPAFQAAKEGFNYDEGESFWTLYSLRTSLLLRRPTTQ